MSIKKSILKAISYLTKKPIPIGTGLTIYDEVHVEAKKRNNNLVYVKKYLLKNDLGYFALEGIVIKQGVTFYKLKHLSTEQELSISEKSFRLLFNSNK